MDHTKCCITVLHCIYQDTHCKQIINLVNSLVLIDHFFINAEEMLDSSIYLSFDSCIVHMLFDLFDDSVKREAALSDKRIQKHVQKYHR